MVNVNKGWIKKPIFKHCTPFTEKDKYVRESNLYPYFRKIEGISNAHVVIDGKEIIMIGSNNYLGLSNHPEVLEAAREAVIRYGSGCTGSRFLNGNMDIHEKLEEELAAFVNKEAACVFTTGFLCNIGALPALSSRHGVIFSDKENHACIADAGSLALSKVVRYAHNDMDDLERLLEKYKDTENKLIATDGIFSMTGNMVDLPRVTSLATKYGAAVFCDDAHALGVIGKDGRGTANYYNCEDCTDLIMGTFSKSLASIGGFVAGPADVMTFMKNHARSFIFSASIPPASVAAALKSLEIIQKEPERLEKLKKITSMARNGLKELGYRVTENDSAIVSIYLNGDRDFLFALSQRLFEKGLFTTPIIPPAVPQGQTMIRTSYMTTHTQDDIKTVLKSFAEVGEEFNLLGENVTAANFT